MGQFLGPFSLDIMQRDTEIKLSPSLLLDFEGWSLDH
jgi:hypothetical protein